MQVKKLEKHLDKILPNSKWNFDPDDCDKILRIDDKKNIVLSIIKLLKKHNYNCTELE